MKKLIHFVVILFCSSASLHVFGQTREIDSLKELACKKQGSERFNLLRDLIIVTQDSDPRLALECAEACVALIPDLQDSLMIMLAYKFKGLFLLKVGREREALSVLDKALQIARRNKFHSERSYISNVYGLCLLNSGEYGKALDMFFQALILKPSDEEGVLLCVLYNNIGLVYYRLGNNERAIENFQNSLIEAEKLDRWLDTERVLVNMALAFCNLKNYPLALSKIQYAFSGCNGQCYQEFQLEGESALGIIKYEMGDLSASEVHLNKSLWLARSTSNFRYISLNLSYLGRIYSIVGRYELAESYLLEAESIAFEKGYTELLSVSYEAFAELFKHQHDYYKLSGYYDKINRLSEGDQKKRLLDKLSVFEVDMKHEANLQTMAHQKQVLDLQDNSLLQQQRIYFGISILIGLMVIILLLLWRRNVQGLKIKALLEQRVMHRTEYLSRKKQILEDSNDFLTRYTDERFKKIFGLIPRLEHAGVYRYENYKSQIEPTILQMKVISGSVQLLRGASPRKDYPDTTKHTLLGSLT